MTRWNMAFIGRSVAAGPGAGDKNLKRNTPKLMAAAGDAP
jgi:hypothetical protein